jgi:hypothetical protein
LCFVAVIVDIVLGVLVRLCDISAGRGVGNYLIAIARNASIIPSMIFVNAALKQQAIWFGFMLLHVVGIIQD